MATGIVPEDWRVANVTPIFKKGSKSQAANYRPVSLISIPCKIMETLLREATVDFLEANQLIKPSQHGFMKHKSCTTNLLEFLEKATSEHDQGNNFDIV